MKSIRKKYFLNISGIFFYLFLLFLPFNAYAEKRDFNDQFQKIITNYRYILGVGDEINVKVLNILSMNYDLKILPDGTINLPRVGPVYLAGKNISEAIETLKLKYEKILYNPILYVNLKNSRPVRVSIIGEVQRPGIYSLTRSESTTLRNSDGGERDPLNFSGWPTVIDAIQKSGGVTSNSDLRRILLKRSPDSKSRREIIQLNYWDALSKGEEFINPRIYDQDIIEIVKVENINAENQLKISRSNFSPATINVIVVGEVKSPGTKQVRSSSPLSEAIFSAGGLTKDAKKTNLALYRLNDNGTIELKKIEYSPLLKAGTENNPTLKDRDVLLIGKNALAKFNSGLDNIVDPISPLLNAASLYRIFTK